MILDEGYKPRNIPHVALEEFLTKIVGKSDVVDWMSIDIEGGEVRDTLFQLIIMKKATKA